MLLPVGAVVVTSPISAEIRQSQVGDNRTNEIQSIEKCFTQTYTHAHRTIQEDRTKYDRSEKNEHRLTRRRLWVDADDTWTLLIAVLFIYL